MTTILPADEWHEARCLLQGPLDPSRAHDAFNALALTLSNGAPVTVNAPFLGRGPRNLRYASLPVLTYEELDFLGRAIFETVDGPEGLTIDALGNSLYTAVREAQASIPEELR